jgi:hypothetical protein
MNKERIERIRWWMLRSQRSRSVASVYKEISQIIMHIAGRRLARVKGVAAVYSRHTHPRSPTFVPGHSDLDLTVILEDDFACDPDCIRKCSKMMHKLGRLFLFTKAEDARFLSQSELSRFAKTFCSPFELLSRPEDWLLIAGREVRIEKSRPFPPVLVPLHAEFNRWWEHVLQTQFFRPSSEIDRGYMRAVYRSALKNQLHLESAKGLAATGPERHGLDELALLKFDENPKLQAILAEIKKQELWVDRPEKRKTELLWHVLKATELFFSGINSNANDVKTAATGSVPVSASDGAERSSRKPKIDHEPHMPIYSALSEKINAITGLSEVLKSAVAYPLPHAFPYIYRVDLVLHEKVALDRFGGACEAIARLLGNKSFAVSGVPVEFTLIPSIIYREPLFFLGSGCPFLLEHIHQFASTVYGSDCPYPAIGWSDADLFRWCRVYLPFHMVTFRRRLEYGSPVLNFCQLASLRVFLETGEKLTECSAVRARYVTEFMKNSEEQKVVDSLFSYPGDPRQGVIYDRALSYVSETYDYLESLLAA